MEKCNSEIEMQAIPSIVKGKAFDVSPFSLFRCVGEPGHLGHHHTYGSIEKGGVVVSYLVEWGNPKSKSAPEEQKHDMLRAEEAITRAIKVEGWKENEHFDVFSQGEQHRRFDDGNGNTLLTTFLSTEQADEE